MGDVEDFRRVLNLAVDEVPGCFAKLQAESHVLVDGHMRIKRIILEDHGDVAVLGRHIVHQVAADLELAAGNLFQPGDHPERRRFAATRRPDENDEFLVGDLQVDVMDDSQRAVGFVQFLECNAGHQVLSPI